MKDQQLETLKVLKECYDTLEDKKAINIKILKLAEKSSVTDYFLIATGTSEPHLRALRKNLEDTLHKLKIKQLKVDHNPDSGWAVIDGFDFMVHIFLEETRGEYNIEKLWKDAEIIDIESF